MLRYLKGDRMFLSSTALLAVVGLLIALLWAWVWSGAFASARRVAMRVDLHLSGTTLTLGNRRRELATRSIDVGAAGVTNRRRDTVVFQTLDERVLSVLRGRRPNGSRRRIERDRIHVN